MSASSGFPDFTPWGWEAGTPTLELYLPAIPVGVWPIAEQALIAAGLRPEEAAAAVDRAARAGVAVTVAATRPLPGSDGAGWDRPEMAEPWVCLRRRAIGRGFELLVAFPRLAALDPEVARAVVESLKAQTGQPWSTVIERTAAEGFAS